METGRSGSVNGPIAFARITFQRKLSPSPTNGHVHRMASRANRISDVRLKIPRHRIKTNYTESLTNIPGGA